MEVLKGGPDNTLPEELGRVRKSLEEKSRVCLIMEEKSRAKYFKNLLILLFLQLLFVPRKLLSKHKLIYDMQEHSHFSINFCDGCM